MKRVGCCCGRLCSVIGHNPSYLHGSDRRLGVLLLRSWAYQDISSVF